MARKANIDQQALVAFISVNFGEDFGSNAVIAAAEEFGSSYPTITKRLEQYKTGHGRWNLTAQDIENTYHAPAA